MTLNLFEETPPPYSTPEIMAPGAVLLRGFVGGMDTALIQALDLVVAAAPFRHLVTPGGRTMSVAMTNCGELGWLSDRRGYRYEKTDPLSGLPWPAIPDCFRHVALDAATEAGFKDFVPDACLINQYAPGTRLSLHQDKDEADLRAPIVSVSLGLPAVFLFGTLQRGDRPARYRLLHGDVAVWGNAARLAFHGIAPLADGAHSVLGQRRINLTFRCAL